MINFSILILNKEHVLSAANKILVLMYEVAMKKSEGHIQLRTLIPESGLPSPAFLSNAMCILSSVHLYQWVFQFDVYWTLALSYRSFPFSVPGKTGFFSVSLFPPILDTMDLALRLLLSLLWPFRNWNQELPGRLMVRTLHFHYWEPGFNFWSRN